MGLSQVKKEAPRDGTPPSAHGTGRPIPGAEAPGWAASSSARAGPLLRARPLGFVVLLLCAGGEGPSSGTLTGRTASSRSWPEASSYLRRKSRSREVSRELLRILRAIHGPVGRCPALRAPPIA